MWVEFWEKEGKPMTIYKQTQTAVKLKYGFVPETCWIADVKSRTGLPMRKASNRKGIEGVRPCPPEKVESIQSALWHFGIIG